MRLIDADALIDKTDDRYSLGEIGRRERDDIVDALEFAPTIEPMRWIPCSEKPIVSGMYIVTLKDEKGLFTDTAEWNPTFGGRWQSVFYDDDDDAIGEYWDISNVVAWMPLPEPWRGDAE